MCIKLGNFADILIKYMRTRVQLNEDQFSANCASLQCTETELSIYAKLI